MVVNFANADMVGHSGRIEPTVKAVEVVDACLGQIYSAVKRKGGAMLVTADHGNAEQMIDPVLRRAADGAHDESCAIHLHCGRGEELYFASRRSPAGHSADDSRRDGRESAKRNDWKGSARKETIVTRKGGHPVCRTSRLKMTLAFIWRI